MNDEKHHPDLEQETDRLVDQIDEAMDTANEVVSTASRLALLWLSIRRILSFFR
jgi:hypothetical protein